MGRRVKREQLNLKTCRLRRSDCSLGVGPGGCVRYNSVLRYRAGEGNSPVTSERTFAWAPTRESCCLGLQRQSGGNVLRKLNICGRPIANKYREGKMKKKKKKKKKKSTLRIPLL